MSDLMPFYPGFGGARFPNSFPFEQNYRCYSASFIDKPHLENGDKGVDSLWLFGTIQTVVPSASVSQVVFMRRIWNTYQVSDVFVVCHVFDTLQVIMPPSALDRLASLRIDYPMLFEVHNPQTQRTSHCGVLEFVADEGMIYMPYWMMQNMLLQEGDLLKVKSATLPKGTFVKLQPHTKDFLDISNPKAVLETTLRNFSCLTVGDNIMVAYNKKQYYIDIIEAKPANAISIIETDCEVDFAPPLDYKEPDRVPAPVPVPLVPTSQGFNEAPEPAEQPKFNPFQGPGRRLDGKAVTPQAATTASKGTSPPASRTTSASSAQPVTPLPQRPPGKLIFGTDMDDKNAPAKVASTPRKEEKKEEPPKEEPEKFQAFTGKKYTLGG